MSSGIAEQVGSTLVGAHTLPEIVVMNEILPASLCGTPVRCNSKTKVKITNKPKKGENTHASRWHE